MTRVAMGWAVLALALTVAGCAAPQSQFPAVTDASNESEARKQREVVLQDALDAQLRLMDVAAPLLMAATPICPDDHQPLIGLSAVNADGFEGEYRTAAASLFGLDDRLKVTGVHPGTPALDAGFVVGDILVSIDGDAIARGSNAAQNWRTALKEAVARDPEGFDMVVERAGAPKVLHVVPVTACGYPVEIARSEAINAAADGEKVMVTRGMLRFTESDAELGLVVAHEIAHNAMGHLDARAQNAVGGAAGGLVLDILAAAVGVNTGGAFTRAGIDAGSGAYSLEFEQEADYVGLYILARAGAPFAEAPVFWRRMATIDPAGVETATTHPTSPARFVALEQAVAEIEQKVAGGAPLMPEMKPVEKRPATTVTRRND